jgi:hypothetical protein
MCIHIKTASELVVKQDFNELTNITKPDLLENIWRDMYIYQYFIDFNDFIFIDWCLSFHI